MNNTKQRRQRYTRRHKNSPNYARWYEIVDWASWVTFGLGFILFIIGLGFLGSPKDNINNDGTIIWAVGLGVWVASLILSLVLIWIDDDYESQQQSQMLNAVTKISPEQWQKIGENMAVVAKTYQDSKKNGQNPNSGKNNQK